jgi:protease secretion system membrane fusion protein
MNTTSLTNVVDASPARSSAEISDANEIAQLNDTRGPIRLGFWVLVVGFGLFLAWASFAPLDEGISAPGMVSVESRRKTIQHLQGGVVKRVLVKEGSLVKLGDVLIELDESAARAGQQSIRQNYLAQRALENRLLAELSVAPTITFHSDLLNANDPMAAQHMLVQQQLFNSRRAALAAEIAAGEQSILGVETQIAGLRQMLLSRRTQQGLQSQQLAGVKALADEGFAPRNQALQLEQNQAELTSSLTDMETQIRKLQSATAETRLHIAQRRQEFAKESSNELANVRREVNANQEKLVAMTQELERLQIKSPSEGQVIGLAVTGIGGVVQPGQHLMDISPRGDSTLLDIRVPPQFIDRAKVGGDVEVRFSAFAGTPHLVVMGKLISLAGDIVTEQSPAGVTSYYPARVALTPEGLKALGDRVIQPGMGVDVLIRTGERSLMTYMLHPLMKRVTSAMTEE